ncbi:4-hydroxy-tetrahydrodipicolinate synthase [Petrotoga olearia]|uniref:4-hydroxy-tetrahydrodipicolinate synthase n=2 Tax=Petrotoga olearia TaxID=156203 RepID=A0A2K1NY00_9BACT|nr:4-hydroxy-tetrahydrodipicolinate synthase [Petrotoga olearia]PNR95413.1 dihydrodipicolinate synthase [Petrotoga olearia DSM 13574]RMA72602.1 dihydrodipicolinate synthase [Petrotoga olearia]
MFTGVGTAMITPFDKEINVDYNSLKSFVKYQLDNGVDSLIVLGTTGEAPAIEEEEREKIVNTVIEVVNKKVPVIVGTGTNNVNHVLKNNKMAESAGADGLLIVTPYYNKSTQKGLVEYFKYISERTTLPIIMYNVPSRTGMNIIPETAVSIHENCKNVIGIKEASGNIAQIVELFSIKPDSLKVFSGNDDQVLPIMSLGGDGLISVASNVAPKPFVDLTHSILNNDLEKARKLNNQFMKLNKLLFREVNPIPVKYAVSLLGLCENVVRLPLVKATPETERLLKEEMERLDLL